MDADGALNILKSRIQRSESAMQERDAIRMLFQKAISKGELPDSLLAPNAKGMVLKLMTAYQELAAKDH